MSRKALLSGPLHCWDFYMEAYHRRLRQAEDIQQLEQLSREEEWDVKWNWKQKLVRESKVILITDLQQVIHFASYNLAGMNGYQPLEVIGKKPKLFQGPETEAAVRASIRNAIENRIPFHGTIMNYRKDGSLYRCEVEEHPVHNRNGEVVRFIAFEKVA
ncbi:MAG TPA: PAS domain S-box protein [Flavisolibacter sp.]|jgi:PAS domain S-box-containing protein|nr:PAS domain S-box protein [Flavisolibacter sp.]